MKAERKFVIIVFCCSLLFHSVVIFTFIPPDNVFKYQILAHTYLNHTLDTERLLDISPLYFSLHILARMVSDSPNAVILWIHILCSACSSVFLFVLLSRFFSRPVAIAGVFLFITNYSVILYTRAFEPEALMIFFVLGFLVFTRSSRPGHAVLAGIFLGLSLLTRSNFFPLIVITPFFFWLTRHTYTRVVRRILLFLLPVVLALSFLIIRNTILTGTLTLFSMNPGYVFYEGNNPNSTGESAIYPPLVHDVTHDIPPKPDVQHVVYRLFARRITGKELSIPEVNAYWTQKAINFIVDHPVHFFKRLLLKIRFFFHAFRRHDLSSVYWNDQALKAHLPVIPYSLISAMALIGMLLSGKHWKMRLLVYMVLFSQFGIMLLTYVSDRQRVVLMPVMIFFTCETFSYLTRNKHVRFVIVPFLLILVFLFTMPCDYIHEDQYIWERFRAAAQAQKEASQARENGNWQLASLKNAYALALSPAHQEQTRLAKLSFPDRPFEEYALEIARSFPGQNFSSNFDLANLYLQCGKLSQAQAIFTALLNNKYAFNRQYLQSSQPSFYLARIALLQIKSQKATEYLEQALRRNPGDPWALSYLFVLTRKMEYKTRLLRYFDTLDVEFFVGKAFLETGEYDEAIKSFRYVAETLPEYRRGRIYLSLALGAAHHYEEAMQHYRHVLEMGRDPIFREAEILNIFQVLVQKYPDNAETLYYWGLVLQDFGHHAEVSHIMNTLLQNFSAVLNENSYRMIERVLTRSENISNAYSQE